MQYVIKNGIICLEGQHVKTDLKINDGIIEELGKGIYHGSEEVIDADGMYVCPGGIDPHTHMDLQQSPKYRACDTSIRAALLLPAEVRRRLSITWPLAL